MALHTKIEGGESKMSVYAKTPMETLPGGCEECKMGRRYGCVGDVKCKILDTYFTGNVKPPYKERPDDCPLVASGEQLIELPPIKIGDEAFFIIKKQIFSGKVYYLRWEHHKSFGIRGDISAECMGGCLGAELSDFGKTVFLTREAAEATLKEQEG